jgi:hypothetical protein
MAPPSVDPTLRPSTPGANRAPGNHGGPRPNARRTGEPPHPPFERSPLRQAEQSSTLQPSHARARSELTETLAGRTRTRAGQESRPTHTHPNACRSARRRSPPPFDPPAPGRDASSRKPWRPAPPSQPERGCVARRWRGRLAHPPCGEGRSLRLALGGSTPNSREVVWRGAELAACWAWAAPLARSGSSGWCGCSTPNSREVVWRGAELAAGAGVAGSTPNSREVVWRGAQLARVGGSSPNSGHFVDMSTF